MRFDPVHIFIYRNREEISWIAPIMHGNGKLVISKTFRKTETFGSYIFDYLRCISGDRNIDAQDGTYVNNAKY